jgi:Cu-Zn family superoxide dismutase
MTLRGYVLLAAIASLLWTLSAAAAPPDGTVEAVRTDFIDGAGRKVGTATLVQTRAGVLIELELAGLPAGWKAFHVHAVGRCEPGTGFKSAGDHFAPREEHHGLRAEKGPHPGDMPNQHVARDGTLRAHVLNVRVTLAPGEASLLDADGSALVLHAKPDDYRSQPAGDAGDRIACATIGARGR